MILFQESLSKKLSFHCNNLKYAAVFYHYYYTVHFRLKTVEWKALLPWKCPLHDPLWRSGRGPKWSLRPSPARSLNSRPRLRLSSNRLVSTPIKAILYRAVNRERRSRVTLIRNAFVSDPKALLFVESKNLYSIQL